MAVVDPELKVRGVDRLRVADASVMPDIVNANTNATCVMIGEKCADLILESADSSTAPVADGTRTGSSQAPDPAN